MARAPLSAWRMPMSAVWLLASIKAALAERESAHTGPAARRWVARLAGEPGLQRPGSEAFPPRDLATRQRVQPPLRACTQV